jgi:hypothetical protein
VELLLLILKSKRATRTSALKCLDFATSGCPPACDRVVDQQGLKTLFAIFMGKLKVGWPDGNRASLQEGFETEGFTSNPHGPHHAPAAQQGACVQVASQNFLACIWVVYK